MSFIGASALHLAIAYSNNDLVTKLLIAGAKMDERAIGKYIRKLYGDLRA